MSRNCWWKIVKNIKEIYSENLDEEKLRVKMDMLRTILADVNKVFCWYIPKTEGNRKCWEKLNHKYICSFHLVNRSLHEKCPNTEFFLVRIQENTDQKKLRVWTLFTHWLTLQLHSGKIFSTTRHLKTWLRSTMTF